MLLSVIGILLPVALLLALGAVLRHIRFFDEAFASKLLRLVFYTALPCMLANSISKAGSLGGVGAATAVLCGAALLARPLGIKRSSIPSFCQTAFRSNSAYVGVPVLTLATAGTALEEETMRVAMLTLAAYSVLCNVGAVLLLAGCESQANNGAGGQQTLKRRIVHIANEIATNPLIFGSVTGLILLALRRGCGITLPTPITKTMSLLGAMATPGALLALGASLTAERLKASLRPASIAVVFKLIICPLLGVAAAAAFNLPPAHRLAVLVYCAA